MNISRLLRTNSEIIIAKAAANLSRSHLRGYESAGSEKTRDRLKALCDQLSRCLERHSASPLIRYLEELARSRYFGGVELSEVQTAINLLQEAIWVRLRVVMKPAQFADAMGEVGTILGLGKDALARTYVSLATKRGAVTLDLEALAEGSEAVLSVD